MSKKVKQVEITFSVSGYVVQQVQLNSDCPYTPEQLQDALNSGEVVTTIQEDGTVDITESGKAIGVVLNVDNNCEYEDFEVD